MDSPGPSRSPESARLRDEPAFLMGRTLRLLLFGGKGGVGKTTCAAAAGIALAERHREGRFLLVSVDPAHSVRDCLAGETPPANLEVVELDAQKGLSEFMAENANTLKEIAHRGTFLDEEDIDRFIHLSLPGLDELIAFLRISAWLEKGNYTTIIVDTAPSGHTLRLLAMPALLREFLDALDSLLAKYRYMKRLYAGGYKPDRTDRLLLDLTAAARRTQSLLRSPDSCFVPVFLAEELSVRETSRLLDELSALGTHIGPLLCNRVLKQTDCQRCQRLHAAQAKVLFQHRALLSGKEVFALPLLAEEVRGVKALEALFLSGWPFSLPDTLDGSAELFRDAARTALAAQVSDPAPFPAKTLSMLFFAGKGGVGKTTLSCAAALALCQKGAGRKVILISTDPAHSIGHCLGVAIGPEPCEIGPGLFALAPDVAAEWQDFQHRYRDELKTLLSDTLPSLDLTFDRQVMERLLALCPPGMDEIMALTRVTDLLVAEPDALLIIDTAPTGHLLRLLEMPELLDEWLKAFFAVLLKYRSVMRMPRLSDRLIALSKRLKMLRKLLRDPSRASLCAVAIPTELSLAETHDLLLGCERMALSVQRLFVNQCTPPGPCALCHSLHTRESHVVAKLRSNFQNLDLTLIERGDPPLGLDAVSALGTHLFLPPQS